MADLRSDVVDRLRSNGCREVVPLDGGALWWSDKNKRHFFVPDPIESAETADNVMLQAGLPPGPP